ncbi:MAG: cysteine--tRNA ligase [Candidatus Saccharimonadales bacterium]
MRLHNTLTRQVEDFSPLPDSEIAVYCCGPTVYDYQHIGNFRKFIFDDTLRRTLEASGYKVKQVMNVTDVGHLVSDADEGEDKLQKSAEREGKSVWEVAKHYTDAFKRDSDLLNILPPNGYQGKEDNYARATDFIDDQIALVKILLDKGFAYQSELAIYFDVSKLPNYGELTGQKLSDKEVAARPEVVTDQNKRHPQDFALWFFTVGHFKNHTMHWPSPWGDGFPGWHLECSAIIHATLGDPIDIHTGGVDNIGTHHVNEMAQTEAAYGHKLANYWLHSEHLLVNNQKMSKSLNNFYTLADVIDKGYSPIAFRLLVLQAHYRTQMNFTWEGLTSMANLLSKLNQWSDIQFQDLSSQELASSYDEESSKILKVLSDDLNTPRALMIVNGMVNSVESLGADSTAIASAAKLVDRLLGLNLSKRFDINEAVKQLIKQREQARQAQDWKKADELRAQLQIQEIDINDTNRGPVWYRF